MKINILQKVNALKLNKNKNVQILELLEFWCLWLNISQKSQEIGESLGILSEGLIIIISKNISIFTKVIIPSKFRPCKNPL